MLSLRTFLALSARHGKIVSLYLGYTACFIFLLFILPCDIDLISKKFQLKDFPFHRSC